MTHSKNAFVSSAPPPGQCGRGSGLSKLGFLGLAFALAIAVGMMFGPTSASAAPRVEPAIYTTSAAGWTHPSAPPTTVAYDTQTQASPTSPVIKTSSGPESPPTTTGWMTTASATDPVINDGWARGSDSHLTGISKQAADLGKGKDLKGASAIPAGFSDKVTVDQSQGTLGA